MDWYQFRPYVPVGQRRAEAAKLVAKLKKQGRTITPVAIEGRQIATTFWGKAWCDHLESYSDYENRLPRGRTYVRNGSVIDLQITPGKVTAMVSGSEVYEIEIHIKKLDSARWKAVKAKCAGQVGSVLELLKGKFDKSVMAVLTDRNTGLFPSPREIEMDCSCPDWASLCKHLAAVLYGVGSRLDTHPELLFVLRDVDHLELIDQAATAGSLGKAGAGEKTLKEAELADVFGIDLDVTPAAGNSVPTLPVAEGKTKKPRATKKPAAKAKKPAAKKPAAKAKKPTTRKKSKG